MGHPGFFIRDEDRGVVQKSKAPPFSHKTGEEWGTRLYAGIVSDLLITLYRPVGQGELELIRENGFREFPPRLPEQPIFYPVLTEEYATQIARDWNTKMSGQDSQASCCDLACERSFSASTRCMW